MAQCPNCGAEIESEGANCMQCGAQRNEPYAGKEKQKHSFENACAHCGAWIPTGKDHCIVCKKPHGNTPYQGKFPPETPEYTAVYPQEDAAVRTIRQVPYIWERCGMWIMGGILIVFLLISGFDIYRTYFDTSAYRAREAMIYLQVNGQPMLTHPDFKQPKKIVGIKKTGLKKTDMVLTPSENGRWLACQTADGALYVLDFAQRQVVDLPEIHASLLTQDLVDSVEITGNSEFLVFLTDQGELYASNMDHCWQLDTRVEQIVALDNRQVLYTRRGDKIGQLDLYLDYLPKDGGELQVIDRNIGEVLDWSVNIEHLIYTAYATTEAGQQVLSLRQFDQGKAANKSVSTTLVQDVGYVLDSSLETRSTVFWVPHDFVWSAGNLVQDDYALRDRAIAHPNLMDYPLLKQVAERWGTEQFMERIQNDEQMLGQYNRYRAAMEQWELKESRDALRKTIQTAFSMVSGKQVLGDLYICQEGEISLLAQGVLNPQEEIFGEVVVDLANRRLLYQKVDPDILQPVKLSQIWKRQSDTFDALWYYLNNANCELVYHPLGKQSSRLYVRQDNSVPKQWCFGGRSSVYFTVEARSWIKGEALSASLYHAPIQNYVIEEAALVERDVRSILFSFGEGIVFSRTDGGMYYMQSDQPKLLNAQSSALSKPMDDQDVLLYYDHLPTPKQPAANLYMLKKDETGISEQVIEYIYYHQDLIYLVKASNQKGLYDLYLWEEGTEQFVSSHIMLPNTQRNY